MFLTIATPTFNRANLLQRLYESLCMQTCRDFEWIVVDDGSTDSTDQLVHRFIEDSKIPIRYLRKPNGGKHTAINLAAKEAQGELFFIADSDDWLPDTAIANVLTEFSAIRSDNSFAGVCGLDMYADGRIVGSGLPCQTIDATPQDIRGKWGIAGDLKEIFRTDIIRHTLSLRFRAKDSAPKYWCGTASAVNTGCATSTYRFMPWNISPTESPAALPAPGCKALWPRL